LGFTGIIKKQTAMYYLPIAGYRIKPGEGRVALQHCPAYATTIVSSVNLEIKPITQNKKHSHADSVLPLADWWLCKEVLGYKQTLTGGV
jgi:hypothetical protein